MENDFRRYGYGTGKVNANVQPKLTEFMNVKRVPALVVVFQEEAYHYPTRELYNGDTGGLREFCEKLATSSTTVPLVSSEPELETFLSSYSKTLRLRVWLLTDKDTLSTSFTILASQFRGEVDFAYSNVADERLNSVRTKYKIIKPSVLVFGESPDEPIYTVRTLGMKRGELYTKIKTLRFASVVRISHQEQFDDACPITYEERQPLCLMYIHFGAFESDEMKHFLSWGAKNAAEMDSEANIVTISGDVQSAFARSVGVYKSAVLLIQRHPKQRSMVYRLDHKSDFGGFTAVAWKGIFSKDDFVYTTTDAIKDETATSDYIGGIYRKVWQYWRRFRHLEEEELLIFIAVPLAILMFSATFLMAGNSDEAATTRRPQPNRHQRASTPEIPIRHIKTFSIDEIGKMINEQVKCLVVLLVKDHTASEAELEVMQEMTRQYAIKVQELKFDPTKPDFFVCHLTKTEASVAPGLDLTPGTILAATNNWWAAYQMDPDDDIYMDNILPHFEHWLARLQEGAVKRNRYELPSVDT